MKIKKLLSIIELNGKNEIFYKVYDKIVFSGEELQILRYFNEKTLESYVSDKSEVDPGFSLVRKKLLVSESENKISISYDLPILLQNVLVYRFLKFHGFESIYFDDVKPKKIYDDVKYFNTKSKDEQAEIIEILRTLDLNSTSNLIVNIEVPKEELSKDDNLQLIQNRGLLESIEYSIQSARNTKPIFCHELYISDKLNLLFTELSNIQYPSC